MPLVQDGYNSSGGKNYRIVSAPKKTPTKTYVYKPSTINGVDAKGSTRIIVRDAKTGALISDTGYLNASGTGAGAGVSVQDVIQAQRSGSSPLQEQPDWNKVSVGQIKTAGYNTLSEYKSAYNKGLAISPSQIPKTQAPTITKTTSQKIQEQLTSTTPTGSSSFKLNIDTKKNLIPNAIPNQDVPLITELGIYNTEKQVTQNLLNSAEYQATIERLNRLKFLAEKEAGLKTESRATDIYNPEALAQRQLFYGEEKQAGDKKEVDSLNAKIIQFNTNYELFQSDYARRDLDPTTPELDLTEKNYEEFTRKNKIFQDQKASLDREQSKVQSLFRERTKFNEELAKIENPIIKGYFDPTTSMSEGTIAGIKEFQRIETEKQYAGTPAQKAFAGKEKNLLTAILATPQIYSEQFKQTGTKTTTNPFISTKNISPQFKGAFTTTTPIYTNIFEGKEITVIEAPRTYEQELEFKKQIGFRAGLAVSRDPYDITDLTKDLETFRNDVLIGTIAGGAIGSIVPAVGTVAGATTGGLTGAVGGATNVITSNVVERQTGSEFLGESLGTVTGIGAEILSAGAISKAVTKTISANPRLIGSPQSIAYDLGGDKLRVIRYSKFKTGTGFLTRKFDVIDDVIIKRSDLLKNLTKEQTEAIFKQATQAPKYLTDDVIKGRIKVGGGKQTTDITKYMGEFTKSTTKKMPLNELLSKIDVTEYAGVQRISVRTGKDLLTKVKGKIKPTVYDDTIEGVSGFQRVREAEKTILAKKGTKTFQFEGVGFSYSEADELAEGIAKAQKATRAGIKKIKDLKLIGKSKYADIPEPEQVFKLNAKQTSTDLQEDVIFIKGKQKGTRLFTKEADDYSRFIAQTREKGFLKTITFQGDETIISPVTKFKSDILTFSGSKGKGQIIRTSTKGLPDEYTLRIVGKADDLPKGTGFTKATVTKASDKVDDALGLNPIGIKPAKEIKLLAEPLSEARKPLLQKELEQAILAYEKNATPATLANVQKLSTEMANLRAMPAILGARFSKLRLNTMNYDRFIKEEFLNKPRGMKLDIKKLSDLKAEQNKAILDFSKKGAVFDPETQAKLDAFQKKYGRNLGDTRLETFGDTGKTFLSDKSVENYLKTIDKPKPKITKPSTDKIIKSSGSTLQLQRTKTITSDLTKKATKSITDTLTPVQSKSKTQTLALTKTKTDTKTLTGSRTDNYARTKQATDYARARTQTKPLFAQPQLKLQTMRNISKLQTRQRILAKNIAITKADTKTETRTRTDTKTETLLKTDSLQATATKQAIATDVITQTDTLTDTKTDTATATATALITAKPVQTPFIKIPSFIIPRIKLPSMPNQPMARKDKTKLYVAQVRVKNNSKWKTVSKPEPYNKAYNEGLDVADNTIGQSVRTVYKKTIKKFIPDDPSIRDYKFRNKKYRSKIPSNPVKIELRQFAIDTFGEKNKLSIERYLAQKKNRTNKRFINKKGVRLI